jgi:beta-glucosidase
MKILLLGIATGEAQPWLDASLSPADRASMLVSNMTTHQKVQLLSGTLLAKGYVGLVPGIPELGIPDIRMNDGPQGFRAMGHPGTSTAWPSGLTMAASWNVDNVRHWGAAMGEEFYNKGAHVLLGPGLCVARVPRNGRNFEYLSGEDPFLGYTLAKPAVEGMQSEGVVANAKHWVNNNQETDRGSVNEVVDERTQFEIYYPPFEGAIEAGVGSVMCSYNKIRGKYACENPETLQQDLKERLGFKGWVMSDWGATHSPSINEGLDQQMPAGLSMSWELKALIALGRVKIDKVDDSVQRILQPLIKAGILDHPNTNTLQNNVTGPASRVLAQRLAAESMVLLQNKDQLLPLRQGLTVAIAGREAVSPTVHGGGSGAVEPAAVSTPLGALEARLGPTAVDAGSDADKAAAVAAQADVAVVFVGTSSTEALDRKSLSLPTADEELISAVAASQPNTIVVMVTPGAILTPWRNDVKGIVAAFMPGQEYGEAVADVLLGHVNPSGRLPLTFPNIENEVNFTKSMWPGVDRTATYSEKLNVGYRWYGTHGVRPAFAFGHGLSYSSFEYDNLHVANTEVRFTVRNTGSVAAVEVPQVYLGFPKVAGEPPMQLKGFARTKLAPGESQVVSVPLTDRSVSIWATDTHSWTKVKGEFSVMVGSSSSDIRLSATMVVDAGTQLLV